jgi:hypothetical protein
MGQVSQKKFLNHAKRALSVHEPRLTWDRLAELAGIESRALKTYRMPEDSRDYRVMPKVVRTAIEALLSRSDTEPTFASISSSSGDVEVHSTATSDESLESILPAALAALVVRQARTALIDGKPITGVARYPGDPIGLVSEDRNAMALVSRARLRNQRSDIGAEIHELLWHCTQPLGQWLSLATIHTERLSNVVLLDAEEGIPTREAEELARGFSSASASLEELVFNRFLEQLGKSSRLTGAGYYTRVRDFVVRHPIATNDELARLTAELPSAIGVLITQQFYEPISESWGREGDLDICAHCGNALRSVAAGVMCRTRACAEILPMRSERREALTGSLRLTRGVRQYWQEPGFDEVRLFDALVAAGLTCELYPHFDRVDIAVGDIGIDLKAYVSPELLGARIERDQGGLAHYRHKWLVIPQRLIERVPAYLERLRSALGENSVRCLATSEVLKEIKLA